jgi:hypothetical protein
VILMKFLRSKRVSGANFRQSIPLQSYVARADPLRDDAFEAQAAGVPEDGSAIAGERVAELDAVAQRPFHGSGNNMAARSGPLRMTLHVGVFRFVTQWRPK